MGTLQGIEPSVTTEAERQCEIDLLLVEKGYTPHKRGSNPGGLDAVGKWEEAWWDMPLRPQPNVWAVVAFIVAVAVFFLILVKGWPFGG